MLEVFLDGVKLIQKSPYSKGHYEECGDYGSVSSKIKFCREEEDGDWTLAQDRTLTIVIRGNPYQ